MSISTKALLANLSISAWGARKFDKQATNTIETTYTTKGKVGNYSKKLLPHAKELDDIARLDGGIRAYFYEQTLPWLQDGSRILKSTNYLSFTREFHAMKEKRNTLVESFIAQYPYLKGEAMLKLGTLYHEGEYPSVGKLRASYACEISFMPIPDVGDFRTEILDSEKQAFLKKMAEMEAEAMRDCWQRLHDVVSRAANKLATPDAVFRDSLLENISEMCNLLPRLNVVDDPALETMRQELESYISKVSAEACRASHGVRNDVATKLADIDSKMSAFMGGI